MSLNASTVTRCGEIPPNIFVREVLKQWKLQRKTAIVVILKSGIEEIAIKVLSKNKFLVPGKDMVFSTIQQAAYNYITIQGKKEEFKCLK